MKATRSWGRLAGLAVLLLALVLGPALPGGTSLAREAAREGFENVPPSAAAGLTTGRSGNGWTHAEAGFAVKGAPFVDIPVSLAGTTSGAISFDLQRKAPGPGDGRQGTIFNILDDEGYCLVLFQVVWAPEGEATPVFRLRGEPYYTNGMGLWGTRVPLDREVLPGDWIHVDLTWDDAARQYGLKVDGRSMSVNQDAIIQAGKGPRIAGDDRRDLNESRKLSGLPPAYFDRPFGFLLQEAAVVRLGLNTVPEFPGQGTSPLSAAVLDNFVITVDKIAPATGVPVSIASVEHDASRVAGFSGSLVAGDTLTVTMQGDPGGTAVFDMARVSTKRGVIRLDWKGYGVYLDEGEPTLEEGEVDLRDLRRYLVYAQKEPFGEVVEGMEPVATLRQRVQEYVIEDLEAEAPYYVAVVGEMRDGTVVPVISPRAGLPMTEDPELPGTYTGSFTVDYADDIPRALVVGRLEKGGAVGTLAAEDELKLDTALRIAVKATPEELPADEASTAEVEVRVTDANGKDVREHEVRFLLATTSEYTGTVGGGQFSAEAGGALSDEFVGETDLFGKVKMTYTAGFAAKTAVIVARDMVSNDVGSAYVKTYIQATAEVELEDTQAVSALGAGYAIRVTSSDDWLTADGRSKARITAEVTRNGKAVEGHRVRFSLPGGNGSLDTVGDGVTGRDGKARAVYTAGTKIGIVVIRATDTEAGISGAVRIELRSDAPAKIAIKLNPEKLPADGRSRADVLVTVTDINDNPNRGVTVEYDITSGGGRLTRVDEETNRRGEASAVYVAGTSPGKAAIQVTVRSGEPTDKELGAARDLAVAVPDYRFF